MNVIIHSLQNAQIQNGIFPATSFTDFNGRADEPFFFGNNWYTVDQQDSGGSGLNVAALVNVAAGNLVLGNLGINASLIPFVGIPQPVYPPSILTVAQFSEMRIVAGTNGGVDTGPCVFAQPNNGNGYMARSFNLAGNRQILLARRLDTTQVLLTGVFNNVNYGDTIRIDVTPAVGQNTVRLLVNGVVIETVIDNNALRPQSGMFGIAHQGTTNATDTWNAYSGGIL